MKNLIIILILLSFCGCRTTREFRADSPLTEIDGLGSLTSIKDRKLDYAQLEKVILAVGARQSVSQEEAQSLAEIYHRHAADFINATIHTGSRKDFASDRDAEHYLALILQHENLREGIRKATDKAVADSIAKSVRFEADEGVIIAGGSLLAVYHNAFNEAVAGSDEKLRDNNYNRIMDSIMFAAAVAFEQAAREINSGQRADAAPEQKTRAADFLRDLKTYNDALPPDARVLSAGGQLPDMETLDDKHAGVVGNIVRGSAIVNKNDEAKDALVRLNRCIFPTYEKLSSATFQKIKR